MLELIKELDQSLFLSLNSFHSAFWDIVMWNISGKLQWVPLYLLLLVGIIKTYGKESWKIILGAVLVVVMADQFSVKLFKEVFQRYRPCHNLDINDIVHIVNNKCGGKFGFVSSHAANTFAIATYLGLFLRSKYSYSLKALIIWASIVSYSRIYLGVHYPLDILGGAMLGALIGFTIFAFLKKNINQN